MLKYCNELRRWGAALIVSLASLMTSAGLAQAGTVTGGFNADNDYMVVVKDGGTITTKKNGPNYWSKKERFSFEINSDNLSQCSVNVIVWGDNSVREGLIGFLRGDAGVMYTGGPGWKAYETVTNSNSTAPVNLAGLLAQTPGPAPSSIADQWNIRNQYTSADFGMAVPSAFSWVKPQNTNRVTRKYWVFQTPCGNLVKEKLPEVKGDHFQCYNLEKGKQLKPETITITDQFGRKQAVLGRPRMLCNPSAKIHRKREFGIMDRERHLVCYDYVRPPRNRPQSVEISNQFAIDDVVATRNQMFCVPSLKKHIGDIRPGPLPGGRPSPKLIKRQDYQKPYIQKR